MRSVLSFIQQFTRREDASITCKQAEITEAVNDGLVARGFTIDEKQVCWSANDWEKREIDIGGRRPTRDDWVKYILYEIERAATGKIIHGVVYCSTPFKSLSDPYEYERIELIMPKSTA